MIEPSHTFSRVISMVSRLSLCLQPVLGSARHYRQLMWMQTLSERTTILVTVAILNTKYWTNTASVSDAYKRTERTHLQEADHDD